MDRAERKRLEDEGWQIGSVADFLGLTDEESVYVELRVRLAEALKARRQAAALSQKAFATAMKSSQSRIAKAEANHHTVSVDLLVRSLIALGVGLGELGSILSASERATSLRKSNHKETKQRNLSKKRRVSAAKSSVRAA